MNILVIGQLTLQWGRLEFGNIGNYYIVEPFFKELHRVFPGAHIRTTFQMTDRFCKDENVSVLPMDLYYGFDGHELEVAKEEYVQLLRYEKTGVWENTTPYIEAVLGADIVIDFSGDMWGENADIAAPNRFIVGLLKNRVAQRLKPTFMLAGSPGPFEGVDNIEFVKEVFDNFLIVTNREGISRNVLNNEGFATGNVIDCACPSFLFEGKGRAELEEVVGKEIVDKTRPIVGMIVCGWNFREAPFSKWPREEDEFEPFINVCEYLSEELKVNVVLMSHSNGFPIPPREFELQHGRDYIIAQELKRILDERKIAKHVYLQKQVLDAWKTKTFIGKMDMLVSGRLHGAVAGISQCVPTVILDYGHEPKAHKLKGFAQMTRMEEYIANPNDSEEIQSTITKCWAKRKEITKMLEKRIPKVKEEARKNFDAVKEYMNADKGEN